MGNRAVRKWKKTRMVTAMLAVCSIFFGIIVGCKVKSNEKSEMLPIITIGTDQFEPYNYLDSKGNNVGVDVELATEAFKRLGYEPRFCVISWEDKEQLLSDEAIDCIWACYTMTGREDKYQWAGPYLYSRQMIVVRSDHDIWKFDDLEGKRIAVQATTKAEDLFLHRIESDLPTVSQVNCFSATEDMFAAIRKNYVDAIAGHEAMLRKFVDDGEGAYRMLEESPYSSALGVAFRKGTHAELADRLTDTLHEMEQDGTTQNIVEKYGFDADQVLVGDAAYEE
ncbi:MAG: transporter substrate-binding domain-containing protein [Clostridiales bacterium]|nr:transporter substrate-binding domain-containing protein [Clostridiales bacterium]